MMEGSPRGDVKGQRGRAPFTHLEMELARPVIEVLIGMKRGGFRCCAAM